MKSSKALKSSPRSPSGSSTPDLCSALQIQELRSFIEREKTKPQSASRFKDLSRPLSARSDKPPTAPKPIPPHDLTMPGTHLVEALQSTKQDSEVSLFLKELGLEKYCKSLLLGGVSTLEALLGASEGQLTALGVALGHRIKILKRAKELQSHIPPEACLVPPAVPAAIPKPDIEEAKKPPKDPRKPPVKPESRPGQPVRQRVPEEVATGLECGLARNERECCWECFHTFFKDVGETLDKKLFCSARCMEKYRKAASIACPCGHLQLKSLAVLSEAKYYCSAKCVPGDGETSAGSLPAPVDESSQGELSVTSKILEKYRHKGQSTIKEVNFEGTQPHLVIESVDEVKGWEAPIDASFDFDRADD